jgi:hypothetical protein
VDPLSWGDRLSIARRTLVVGFAGQVRGVGFSAESGSVLGGELERILASFLSIDRETQPIPIPNFRTFLLGVSVRDTAHRENTPSSSRTKIL